VRSGGREPQGTIFVRERTIVGGRSPANCALVKRGLPEVSLFIIGNFVMAMQHLKHLMLCVEAIAGMEETALFLTYVRWAAPRN
jgi:hypothetical protein